MSPIGCARRSGQETTCREHVHAGAKQPPWNRVNVGERKNLGPLRALAQGSIWLYNAPSIKARLLLPEPEPRSHCELVLQAKLARPASPWPQPWGRGALVAQPPVHVGDTAAL